MVQTMPFHVGFLKKKDKVYKCMCVCLCVYMCSNRKFHLSKVIEAIWEKNNVFIPPFKLRSLTVMILYLQRTKNYFFELSPSSALMIK